MSRKRGAQSLSQVFTNSKEGEEAPPQPPKKTPRLTSSTSDDSLSTSSRASDRENMSTNTSFKRCDSHRSKGAVSRFSPPMKVSFQEDSQPSSSRPLNRKITNSDPVPAPLYRTDSVAPSIAHPSFIPPKLSIETNLPPPTILEPGSAASTSTFTPGRLTSCMPTPNTPHAIVNAFTSLGIDGELPDALWCYEFERVREKLLYSQTIENIDENAIETDAYCSSYYLQSIHDHYKSLEEFLSPPASYLSDHHFVSVHHRSQLVDEMIDLCRKNSIEEEVLHLSVNVVDRYLSLRPAFRVDLMMWLGISSLLMCNKYFDAKAIPMEIFLRPLLGESPTREKLEGLKANLNQMEVDILTLIKWDINAPTIYSFLLRYQRAGSLTPNAHNIAVCIAERCLLEYDLLHFPPSLLAASIVCMARKYNSSSPSTPSAFIAPSSMNGASSIFSPLTSSMKPKSDCWNATLQFYSSYTQEDILPCVERIQQMLVDETIHRARSFALRFLSEQQTSQNSSTDEEGEDDEEEHSSPYNRLLNGLQAQVDFLQEELNHMDTIPLDAAIDILAQRYQGRTLVRSESTSEKRKLFLYWKKRKMFRLQYLTYLPGILEFGATRTEKYKEFLQRQLFEQAEQRRNYGGELSNFVQTLIAPTLSFSSEGKCDITPSSSIYTSSVTTCTSLTPMSPLAYSQDLYSPYPLKPTHSFPGTNMMSVLHNEDSQLSAMTDHDRSYDHSEIKSLAVTPAHGFGGESCNKMNVMVNKLNQRQLFGTIDDMITDISDVPMIYESVRTRYVKVYSNLITCPP